MNSKMVTLTVTLAGMVYGVRLLAILLRASQSVHWLMQTIIIGLVLPLLVWCMLISRKSMFYLLFFLFVFDLRLVVGLADVELFFVFGYAAIGVIVLQCLLRGERLMHWDRMDFLCMLILALAVIRYAMNPALPSFGRGAGTGFKEYFRYFGSFAPFILIPQVIDREKLHRLPVVLFWLALATVAIKIAIYIVDVPQLSYYFGIAGQQLATGRVVFLATAARFLVLTSLTLVIYGDKFRMRFGLSVFGLCLGVILIALAGMRALMGGTLIALGLGMVYSHRVKALVAVCILILPVAMMLIFSSPVFIDSPSLRPMARAFRFVSGVRHDDVIHDRSLDTYTFRWRQQLWMMSIQSVREHPMLGRGFSGELADALRGWSITSDAHYHLGMEAQMHVGVTHNLWLAPFVVFGIPAGILFMLYVIKRAYTIYRMMSMSRVSDHALAPVAMLLFLWLFENLVNSVTSGGAVNAVLMMLMAISHSVECCLEIPDTNAIEPEKLVVVG